MYRIISQDGKKDLPYDQIYVILNDTKIECFSNFNSDLILLAEYSTNERAYAVMENLHKSYGDCLYGSDGKHYIRNYFRFPNE